MKVAGAQLMESLPVERILNTDLYGWEWDSKLAHDFLFPFKILRYLEAVPKCSMVRCITDGTPTKKTYTCPHTVPHSTLVFFHSG